MARGVRKQEGENLSEESIEKVIKALEKDKPITKKEACEMLSISYNTTRLNKIITEHKEKIEFRTKMRKKMRSQPIDKSTASDIASSYLSGSSLQDISNRTYRSINVVKNVLKKYNIPIRSAAVDYFHPIFIDDDDAIAENYKIGDLVYSARYDEPATIRNGHRDSRVGKVYHIWLHKTAKFAYQAYYELADLRKLQTELDIKMKDMDAEEIRYLIAQGLISRKKQEDKRK
jgi:transposase